MRGWLSLCTLLTLLPLVVLLLHPGVAIHFVGDEVATALLVLLLVLYCAVALHLGMSPVLDELSMLELLLLSADDNWSDKIFSIPERIKKKKNCTKWARWFSYTVNSSPDHDKNNFVELYEK